MQEHDDDNQHGDFEDLFDHEQSYNNVQDNNEPGFVGNNDQNYKQSSNFFMQNEDYSDEDEKLFDQQNEEKTVAKIQESIDDLIEKGKKRSLQYHELIQRRETKKRRLMQLDEAKTYLLLNIGRAFMFNAHQFNSVHRGVVLSLIPMQYQVKYLDRDFVKMGHQAQVLQKSNINSGQKSKQVGFSQQIRDIIAEFNKIFGSYLDTSKECLMTKKQNFLKNLTENKKLSKIEYMILFSIFLSLHKLVYRVNFVIDISTMEDSKVIKVSRKGQKGAKRNNEEQKYGSEGKANNDKFLYGRAQQIIKDKKTKYDDHFLNNKLMNIVSESEDENKSSLHESFKRFKLNDESDNVNSNNLAKVDEMIEVKHVGKQKEEIKQIDKSFFDKFSFKPSNTTSVTKQRGFNDNTDDHLFNDRQKSTQGNKTQQKTQRIQQTQTQTQNSSHLNIMSGRVQQSIMPTHLSKDQEQISDHFQSPTKDLDIAFEENLFIEIYDELNHRWSVACPFTGDYYTTHEQVQTYMRVQKTLFILSSQSYKSYEFMRKQAYINKSQDFTMFMREIGTTYVHHKFIKDYLKAKNSCILTKYVEEFVGKFAPSIETLEQSFIPSTTNEFKNNKYYTLPSLIRKYQGFLPNAVPLDDKTFKGEPIFLRKDISELHTVERWRKYARQVKSKEEPVKRVKGLYNDPERMAELYGYWQTIPWRNELTEDGKIPRNQYGNIEIMSGPIPEGTIHIDIPKAALICKKLEIDFVPAVIGFEKGGNGKSHPCVSGVVTFKQHHQQVLDEYKKLAEQSKKRQQENITKKAKKAWKDLLRSILVKKYISSTYDVGEQPMKV
eukprot:403377346